MDSFNVIVYLKSPKIETDFTILPVILNDFDPIMGDHRVCVQVSNPTLITAAKRSGMRLYEYLSTIYNLGYIKESGYRDLCQRMWGGVTEIPIPGVGRVDLVTEDSIVEVKSLNLFKHAIGQILTYGLFYPDHKKVIALTPCKTNYDKDLIKDICTNFDIEVIFL